MNITVVIVTILYLVGMVIVGIFFSGKVKDLSDFYVGGRRIPAPAVGFSFAATQMSGSTYMGSVGIFAQLGYSCVGANIGSAMATFWAFPLIGVKMRRVSAKLKSLTVPDILADRYESPKAIRILVASFLLIGYIPFMMAQIKAASNAMEVLIGLPYITGVFVFGGLVALYVYLGGMFAVAWTDLIQGIVMILGFAIVVPIALSHVGGLLAMNTQFAAINPNLVTLRGIMPLMWMIGIAVTFGFFQIGGNPSSMVRFLIGGSTKSIKRAMLWSTLFSIFIFGSYAIIAPAGRVMFPAIERFDLILPMVVKALLPPVVSGIILSAILAAVMSSVDSVLLVAGSAAARDIYQKVINPNATERKYLLISRISVAVIGVIVLLLALHPPTAILWLVTITFSFFASAFTAVMIATFWWPGATRQGAIWSILSGGLMCIIWYAIGVSMYGSWNMWPGGLWPPLVGAPVSAIVLYIVSKMTSKPSEKTLRVFFG